MIRKGGNSQAAKIQRILAVLLAGSLSVHAVPAAAQIRQAFHMEVLFPPQVARLADTIKLEYELHLTNFAHTPLSLNRLLILDGDTGGVIGDLDRVALDKLTVEVNAPNSRTGLRKIAPGMRVVVYLDLPIAVTPRRLRHRIEFGIVGGSTVEHARAEGGETPIDGRSAPTVGPPLRGGPWVAVYDPHLKRGHRRVVYAINGRARIPGRFAVDWMKPIGAGVADGFGSEVLAVADAVVVAARDDFSDINRSPSPALEDATGNYIALDLGAGVYAFYEHLQAGLLVSPGDRVRRGQVIARLGATGHARRPHLHFHVSDSNSPLAAEGLPFELTNVLVLGAYESIDSFLNGDEWVKQSAPRKVEEPFFPSPNMVVEFPTSH